MEDKAQFEVLLVKYLAGELDEEDELLVEQWIEADDHNRQDFESLQDVWVLSGLNNLKEIDTDTEWIQLKNNLEKGEAKVVAMSARQNSKTEFTGHVDKAAKNLRKILFSVAVAASAIICIVFGFKYFSADSMKVRQTVVNENVEIPASEIIRYQVKKTEDPKVFLLNDGSTIVLFPNSEISLSKRFAENKRDILLSGKAEFTVAHDEKRPFTVFSSDLITTDIGTRFTVTAFEDENQITVRLNEGKVMISPVDKENTGFKKDIILLPGHQLVYHKISKTFKVFSFKEAEDKQKKRPPEIETESSEPKIPMNYKGSWFMFNNQPLTNIFESLEQMYDTKIIYQKAQMKKLYFIGTFNKTDSLEGILNQIARLNNLHVVKKENSFIISNTIKK